EKQHRLHIDKPAYIKEIEEMGNVYSINSTYLEIIDDAHDRIQAIGFAWITGIATSAIAGFMGKFFITLPSIHSPEIKAQDGYWPLVIIFASVFSAMALLFFLLGLDIMRRNLFALKRRPIRLNRKTRRIYA
ncbi:hypothetical protein NLO82_27500, partial [Escherichia coli]|nr:hypothetical protein [Escherichia coli]